MFFLFCALFDLPLSQSKKCLEEIFLPDLVLCLHIAWNILYAGLADGSVASYDLKVSKNLWLLISAYSNSAEGHILVKVLTGLAIMHEMLYTS